MGVGNVDLNIRSLDYNTFDDDDPGTIILVRLIAWCDRYKKCKEYRKEISKKLIPVVWHSRLVHVKGWEKGNRTILIDEK